MENPSLLGEGEGYVGDVDEAIENISVPKKVEKKHLRSPICLMIGHELSGKTALLDCIRGTESDNNDFQHYRATYVPAKNIRERTRKLKSYEKIKVPGLLFIDTLGFISIPSLKYRGLALCDIAILVVDINIGLRPQTIETLNLLNMCKTKFIVVLNQVDRIYGWKTCHNASFPNAYMKQSRDAEIGFCSMLNRTIWQFRQHGIVTKICYQNKEMRETVSIVPTSAISGEGISDMLLQLVMWTQKTMVEKLTYREELQCIILDVNDFEDRGTTLNVVLVNGVLHEGDQIAVCGRQGTTIVTSIQALLKTPPLMELGAKGDYIHCKKVKGAKAVKIIAQGLEDAVVGSNVYMAKPDEDFKEGELVKGKTMRIIGLQNYIIFLGLIAVVMLLLPWLYLMC